MTESQGMADAIMCKLCAVQCAASIMRRGQLCNCTAHIHWVARAFSAVSSATGERGSELLGHIFIDLVFELMVFIVILLKLNLD